MALDQYTYVFAIGTFFALLDAYNNGASKFTSTDVSHEQYLMKQMMSQTPGLLLSLLDPSRTDRP
jgi:sodium-dependent phosphate transporter